MFLKYKKYYENATHTANTIKYETVYLFDATVVLGAINVSKLPDCESKVGVESIVISFSCLYSAWLKDVSDGINLSYLAVSWHGEEQGAFGTSLLEAML